MRPLLDGEIRSAFAMTEPDVASSDATNIEMLIERDGDEYVMSGRKWWTSGALRKRCEILIVMGKTDRCGHRYRQQSMILVPRDTPGVTVRAQPSGVRLRRPGGPRRGAVRQRSRARVEPDRRRRRRVPDLASAARARADPPLHAGARRGRARARADVRRAQSRVTFGQPVSDRANIQDWIAESRIEIEMARLLTMKAAWLMDTVGNKRARTEISAIKVAAPNVALA